MTSTVIDAGDDLSLTIPALICEHAEQRGEQILLATDRTHLTYAAANTRSQRLARGLLAAGVQKGSHVGLLLPNDEDFIVFALAVARIGAVILPFSTLSTADEINGLLTRSDTSFLIVANEFRGRDFSSLLSTAFPSIDFSQQPTQSSAAPWLRRMWFTDNAPAGWPLDSSVSALEQSADSISDTQLNAVEQRVKPSDHFVIIHTSGSTSEPKGVIHTHGALIRHLNNINEIRSLNSEDKLFSVSPWFWIAGFGFALMGVLVAGATLVTSNSREAGVVLDLIEQERPTMTNGYAPTVAWLTADPSFKLRDFSWLRRGNLYPLMAPDACPSDPTLRHDLYGMSETGSGLTMSADESDLPETLRGSCGKFLPGYEAKIVDTGTGNTCKTGDIGELWIRGPFLMAGYYGKSRKEVFEPDGWWRTSDAGTINSDGLFFLKGRLGNMIKTAGANVAPREVEAAMSNLTGGKLCVVLGIPDLDRGQSVIAIVVAESAADVDEQQLRQQLAEKLSSYKVPRRILQFSQEELPTLSSGKLDLQTLAIVVEQHLATPAAPVTKS